MKILVISQQYKKGGLETHINTLYETLKDKNEFVFVFGEYEDNKYLTNAKIYDKGFKFNYFSTVYELLNDIERLVNIIELEKIDLIHVHPFYTLIPAVFAANITNTKIIYTCHGRGSFTFADSINDSILFNYFIKEYLNLVYCVNNNCYKWLDNPNKNIKYYPNLIDEKKYSKHIPLNNKKAVLISRLDKDKINEIRKFLEYLPKLEIESIDIFGDGSEINTLRKYIEEKKLENKVFLKGYKENIYEILKDNYAFVIGQGRVAIEALTMNYPTFIIGFGKVIGLIDEKIYEELKKQNFVVSDYEDTPFEKIEFQIKEINNNKLEKYQLRERTIKDFGLYKIKEYITDIKRLPKKRLSNILNCYYNFYKIEDKNVPFYSSNEVFYILKRHIETYTNNMELKNLINIYNNSIIDNEEKTKNILKLNQKLQKEIKKTSKLNRELVETRKEIEKLNNKINSITLISLLKELFKKRRSNKHYEINN